MDVVANRSSDATTTAKTRRKDCGIPMLSSLAMKYKVKMNIPALTKCVVQDGKMVRCSVTRNAE